MINNDEEDMTNDEESWSGMEDYDEGRAPDPTNEDALDWGEEYGGCGYPGCHGECDDDRDFDDED